MKSHAAALFVLLVASLVSACGGSDAPSQAPRFTDQPAITGEPAGFNAADVAFATAMVTLYRQATELTDLAPERSNDPNVVALAADVGAAQRPDEQMMNVFLVQWNSNSDAASNPDGHDATVPGTVDETTMARLKSLSGKDFDSLWLQSMINHQQGALDVAEAEVAHGANVDAVASAKQFVGTYQAQIDRLKQLLAG
ncbi:MAG: DUF305 domain-containing protein [Mycolicibacterium sp.]|nr:DUF305 domain-containing protein [Mycolicibacterium sp.]